MPSDAIDATPARRRVTVLVVATLLIGAIGTWYAWPAVSGDHGGVAVITDASSAPVVAPLTVEVRNRGRQLTDAGRISDWCALAERAGDLPLPHDTEFLVIALDDRGNCAGDPTAAVVTALDDRSIAVVIVVAPGTAAPGVDARTVPVEALLGPPGRQTATCEWWDTCAPGAVVTVRSTDGQLTDVGYDRIARMVAATIG